MVEILFLIFLVLLVVMGPRVAFSFAGRVVAWMLGAFVLLVVLVAVIIPACLGVK